jgi:hypothetical protein
MNEIFSVEEIVKKGNARCIMIIESALAEQHPGQYIHAMRS